MRRSGLVSALAVAAAWGQPVSAAEPLLAAPTLGDDLLPAAGRLVDGEPAGPLPGADGMLGDFASAAQEPRTVYLFYADGGPSPVPGVCTATPPAYGCRFGESEGVEGCKRKVQEILDRWYRDFNVVFTMWKPVAGRFYTAVVTSSGAAWCGLPDYAGGVAPASCQDTNGGTCYAFRCDISAKSCANIIAQEQAHLVGLMHTNSDGDLLAPMVCGACDGFEDRDNGVVMSQCRPTQNSYRMMKERLGAWPEGMTKPDPFVCRDLGPPRVAITEPADGAVVGASFRVAATADDECGLVEVRIEASGVTAKAEGRGPFAWDLGGFAGAVQVRVTAVDGNRNEATATVTVTARDALPPTDAGSGVDGDSPPDGLGLDGGGGPGARDPEGGDAGCACVVGDTGRAGRPSLAFLAILLLAQGAARRRATK